MSAISGLYLRRCDECKMGMNQGYLADDHYYCSEECLHENFTPLEWALAADGGESDYFYYTEWDEYSGEEELYLEDGTELNVSIAKGTE